MENLQHLHDQSCCDYKVSKGTETFYVSPDQVVLVHSAAPFQDISVPSAAVLCGCASPEPTLSQFPHQWLRSCFTFAGVQQRMGACISAKSLLKIGELQCQLPRAVVLPGPLPSLLGRQDCAVHLADEKGETEVWKSGLVYQRALQEGIWPPFDAGGRD